MAVYPIDARYIVEDKATQIIDTKPKAHCVFIDASNKHVYVPVLRLAPTTLCSSSSMPAPAC